MTEAAGATTAAAVLLHRDGAVARLVLNRPARRNALDDRLVDDLDAALRELAATSWCRAVVLTGAGSAFCGGGDLAANATSDIAVAMSRHRRFLALAERLQGLPLPTVAAVNGAAVGAGASLALLCDEVVLSRSAFFSLSFLQVGLPPDLLCAATLQRRVGWTVAAELLHSGRRVQAAEAVELRMAHDVADDVLAAAEARAQALAALSPSAFAASKAMLRHAAPTSPGAADLEVLAVGAALASQEFLAATASFRRTRPGSSGTASGPGAAQAEA